MISKIITIQIERDEEHPVAMLVQIANQFESKLHIRQGNTSVNCKSIMGMLTLDLKKGLDAELSAEGPDEDEAIRKLQNYLEGK